MPRAAVLGSPIKHSLSPLIHNAGYQALDMDDWSYSAHLVEEGELAHFLKSAAPDFLGFSVTMPAKFAALKCADFKSERAEVIGSANTLVRRGTEWGADNTDCVGITGALVAIARSPFRQALIIGAGGTARPAVFALGQLGVQKITIVNRSDRATEFSSLAASVGIDLAFCDFSADLATLAARADILISTVPSRALAGYEDALARTSLLDVIYDPWPTPLVQLAQSRGLAAVGGHEMLLHQAYEQFEIFTGRSAPREQMRSAFNQHLSMEN
ncbi:shikimate dehydrogenase [Corynebacterium sp. ES2715-CONJ3]|uniref:shikimate dehydrogenase n=1 Tax=Corynebacterium sp. ES2715-CONJ3 TaxID=2974028 RepID=UPI00216816BA|nr:shikimate dehydrogenase [Corynebacterium sp. ES2715-CONJ3]MCS4491065.1 shikimate dehydrogenase [Corynebacterium sp. ES2715-CONJ3]